ncbi:MAG: hypothetical protein VB034_02530 [Eubacteriales bacterium]|nr:hypothetical protein [Eubacteriales bacterium]
MLVAFHPTLSTYHEIRANSYQTEEWYNDVGKFTLVVPPTTYNIRHLIRGAILFRTGVNQAMVVTRVSPDTSQDRITVNGYTTNWLLNKRAVAAAVTISNVESGLYAALDSNQRGLPHVETAALKSLPESYSAILSGGQLLDVFLPILDAVGLGQRMNFDTTARKHVFEIYKGSDLTTGSKAVIFSDEQGTARDLKIEDDESLFKNVIYVLGTLMDGTPIVRTIGTAAGAERFEYWHDSRLKQTNGESLTDFQARLDASGAAEAAKRVRSLGFSVRVDPGEYGSKYCMGDRVRCVSNRFGMQFTAVISGVKRTIQAQNETVSVVLGEPEITVLGEMKLSWQR